MRTSVRVAGSVLTVVAGALLAIGLVGRTASSHADGAGQALTPPSQVVHVGESVTVDVSVSGVTNLAAWQITMRYDDTLLQLTGFQQTGWLGSTGRSVQCQQPFTDSVKWNPPGTVVGCDTIGPGASNGGVDGPSGDGVVAHLTFKALATGTANIALLQGGLQDPLGDDCCGTPALSGAAVKVTDPGSSDTTLPPTATPNPVERTPIVPSGAGGGGSYVLPTQVPGSGGSAGSSGGSGNTGSGSGTSGVGSIDGSGGRGGSGGSGGTLAASGSGAKASGTGAPHAGQGTLVSRHSMAVELAAGIFALAGAACFAVLGVSRRRSLWTRWRR